MYRNDNTRQHLGTFLRETMLEVGTISQDDMELALVTDKIPEAIDYIKTHLTPAITGREENEDVY